MVGKPCRHCVEKRLSTHRGPSTDALPAIQLAPRRITREIPHTRADARGEAKIQAGVAWSTLFDAFELEPKDTTDTADTPALLSFCSRIPRGGTPVVRVYVSQRPQMPQWSDSVSTPMCRAKLTRPASSLCTHSPPMHTTYPRPRAYTSRASAAARLRATHSAPGRARHAYLLREARLSRHLHHLNDLHEPVDSSRAPPASTSSVHAHRRQTQHQKVRARSPPASKDPPTKSEQRHYPCPTALPGLPDTAACDTIPRPENRNALHPRPTYTLPATSTPSLLSR
ncbi:hypothetical protein B0H13DRAFT_2323787 [Mycena leptocephala]|nr:hypothetical protein B0H13DRAFT_2323787 [Mycena leptocephala]